MFAWRDNPRKKLRKKITRRSKRLPKSLRNEDEERRIRKVCDGAAQLRISGSQTHTCRSSASTVPATLGELILCIKRGRVGAPKAPLNPLPRSHRWFAVGLRTVSGLASAACSFHPIVGCNFLAGKRSSATGGPLLVRLCAGTATITALLVRVEHLDSTLDSRRRY